MALPSLTPAGLPAEIEAYCPKCKAPRKMVAAQRVQTKNGRATAKGKCPVCGTTLTKFLPK